ncbi:hypothetical protein [Streptomyces sp. NPDC055085]
MAAETIPMSPKGLELCHRFKELFHAYTNRMDRSQQSTMGPSEVGSPCDRRLAMSLLRYRPVNPGGDNWASWVGTQIHPGIEEMFVWADAGSGRYAPELKLIYPNVYVPKGTSDLLDRTLLMIVDWKAMGQWSRNKLKTKGPSRTYRVQTHVYGYGARLKGEKVNDVAIAALPRDASSLDDMYVWTEPYNPTVAREALERVDRIAHLVIQEPGEVARDLNPAMSPYELDIDNSECKFCPFHMPRAVNSEEGWCNGKR